MTSFATCNGADAPTPRAGLALLFMVRNTGAMYLYRTLSREGQWKLIHGRHEVQAPLHSLAHRSNWQNLYLLTGANFEHRPIMGTAERRDEFAAKLLERFYQLPDQELYAWCLLPNHYHLLARVDLIEFGRIVARLHNGTSTQWNREDGTPRRRVWFSFCDRDVRGEAHFYSCLNYVHANAVKHGYVTNAFHWPWSSVHDFAEYHGRETLRRLWRSYPVRDMGKGWDE